jgi:hypothetical protein
MRNCSAFVVAGVSRHALGGDNSRKWSISRAAETIEPMKMSIWCPCPEHNESGISSSEAGEEI